MHTQHGPKRTRREAVAVGAVVVAVGAVFTVVALTTGTAAHPAAAGATGAPVAPAPAPATSSSVGPVALPSPQPTRTAGLHAALAVKPALSVSVTKTEAVSGVAEGPGEIAGPSVRFTVTVRNTTGRAVDLSTAVVNAYYGTAKTPAVQLDGPGGVAFPASVADGATATGVFVFNVPKADRGTVQVTVDTAVENAVVAFTGAAPTE